MKIKALLAAAALSTALVSVAEAAQQNADIGTFSGNVGFTSKYRFRGLDQNNEKMAVQGGLDWEHKSGFYAGVWGSNVDFNVAGDGSLETDVYGGYKMSSMGIDWDVGILGYFYPGSPDGNNYDYWEAMIAAGKDFGMLSAGVSLNYSPEFYADTGAATYIAGNVEVPFKDTNFSATGSFGHQWIQDNVTFNAPDYSDWSLGVGYAWNGFDFAAQYVDTNISDAACFGGASWCDAAGIFSVSRSF